MNKKEMSNKKTYRILAVTLPRISEAKLLKKSKGKEKKRKDSKYSKYIALGEKKITLCKSYFFSPFLKEYEQNSMNSF